MDARCSTSVRASTDGEITKGMGGCFRTPGEFMALVVTDVISSYTSHVLSSDTTLRVAQLWVGFGL